MHLTEATQFGASDVPSFDSVSSWASNLSELFLISCLMSPSSELSIVTSASKSLVLFLSSLSSTWEIVIISMSLLADLAVALLYLSSKSTMVTEL